MLNSPSVWYMASPCYYSATAQSSDFASQAQAVHILESQNKLVWIPGTMFHCNIHSVQWLQHCCLMLLWTTYHKHNVKYCALLLIYLNSKSCPCPQYEVTDRRQWCSTTHSQLWHIVCVCVCVCVVNFTWWPLYLRPQNPQYLNQ